MSYNVIVLTAFMSWLIFIAWLCWFFQNGWPLLMLLFANFKFKK